MPTHYHITPYDPILWKDGEPEQEVVHNLKVKFSDFVKAAQQRWPQLKKYPPFGWEIDFPGGYVLSGSIHGVKSEILTMEVGNQLNEFALWYRSYIPIEHELYLFCEEGGWERLPLTAATTLQEIAEFTGL